MKAVDVLVDSPLASRFTEIYRDMQPYWDAEATMLMHTRGILIQTAKGSMVLTGKEALDFSGGVSAEDNLGIGGYERIMGPNGQAQYAARDLADGRAFDVAQPDARRNRCAGVGIDEPLAVARRHDGAANRQPAWIQRPRN